MKNKFFKILIGGLLASFILTLCFVFVGVFASEEESTESTVDSALEWLRTWSINDLKGWIIGTFSFLGVNSLTLGYLVFALLRGKLQRIQQDKTYQDLIAKLNVEHQKEMESTLKAIDDKLVESQNIILNEVKNLDEEKKQEATKNIAVLKESIGNLKAEADK